MHKYAKLCQLDPMTQRTLTHHDVLPPGTSIHLTRALLTPARPKALHTHDFTELFWVQNGTLRHHLPSGVETLTEGALILLRPGQPHALQGRGDAALAVSIAIHPDLVQSLDARLPSLPFWLAEHGPARTHRDSRQLVTLNHAAGLLERGPCDSLAAEAFLLPLLADLIQHETGLPTGAPTWLHRACAMAHDPAIYRGGAATFVSATGQSHPHVSRSMRRWLGHSPTQYVNQIRMTQAARALTSDSEPMAEVAAAVGIANLSHFHKLFRSHHGVTPLHYRQQFQRDVVQPSA
jgi:AraC family cel operon transcriptional repressor